jgi:hypothetical protein
MCRQAEERRIGTFCAFFRVSAVMGRPEKDPIYWGSQAEEKKRKISSAPVFGALRGNNFTLRPWQVLGLILLQDFRKFLQVLAIRPKACTDGVSYNPFSLEKVPLTQNFKYVRVLI